LACYYKDKTKILINDCTVVKNHFDIKVLCFMDNKRCDYEFLLQVARRLKQIREAKGLSQRIVYIDTDINIGRIEVGKSNFGINTLRQLCTYYGITLEEFFHGF